MRERREFVVNNVKDGNDCKNENCEDAGFMLIHTRSVNAKTNRLDPILC